MFSAAADGCIAAASSSGFAGVGWIGRIEAKPLLHISSLLRLTIPAIARTGMPLSDALLRTLDGSLPQNVWQSILPSPVMIRSLSSMISSNLAAFSIRSAPLQSFPFKKVSNAPPVPPAAPEPAISPRSMPYSLKIFDARDCIPFSSILMSESLAPFCGANT